MSALTAALAHATRDRLPPTPMEQCDLAAARVQALVDAYHIALWHAPGSPLVHRLQDEIDAANRQFDGAHTALRAHLDEE
jgi:hypothetical protein